MELIIFGASKTLSVFFFFFINNAPLMVRSIRLTVMTFRFCTLYFHTIISNLYLEFSYLIKWFLKNPIANAFAATDVNAFFSNEKLYINIHYKRNDFSSPFLNGDVTLILSYRYIFCRDVLDFDESNLCITGRLSSQWYRYN